MDVALKNAQKTPDNFGKNLRKRKNESFEKRAEKKRAHNNKTNSRRKPNRRHKSRELPEVNDLSEDEHIVRPSVSTSSLSSVIYLGYYRKIPPLITLDENSDLDKGQNKDKIQGKGTESQNIEASTYILEKTDSNQIINDTFIQSNESRDTNNLLNLLNDMCVGATRTRSSKMRIRRYKRLIHKEK